MFSESYYLLNNYRLRKFYRKYEVSEFIPASLPLIANTLQYQLDMFCLDVCYNSPLSTILPKRFLPRRKFLVEQFHLLCLNWCWHSVTAILAPFATALRTPGFSLARRLCFRRNDSCIVGSMYKTPGDTGDKLFGSPAFAIPL